MRNAEKEYCSFAGLLMLMRVDKEQAAAAPMSMAAQRHPLIAANELQSFVGVVGPSSAC